MGLLLAVVAVVGGLLYAVLIRVLADECKAWLPWITERVIRHAVRKLPANQRERYGNEWHSYLDQRPGNILKLFEALGFEWTAWTSGRDLAEEVESETPGTATSIEIIFGVPVPRDDAPYVLHIRPERGGFGLVGYQRPLEANSNPQDMYKFCESIEAVTDSLTRLGLPAAQIEAVRRIAPDGVEQQIGGYGFPLLFPRTELVRVGMSFPAESI